jgi:hypothetical protein
MFKKEFKFHVMRFKESYDYKYDSSLNGYKNNIKNNSLDSMSLYYNGMQVWYTDNVQTVSNHPLMKYSDTVAPGIFRIKCFLDPKSFHGDVHGIINAQDLNGQPIDKNSMQWDNGYYIGRFLIHSRYSKKKKRDLYNGYSGGCFIPSTPAIEELNNIMRELGIKELDEIKCELQDIGDDR